ncbi:MAG: hypothetical protein JHD03_04325 [Solirubrobacteraceae bacterium]|nr:hypothetical protein [Solirubrobacteraceae bacterium]
MFSDQINAAQVGVPGDSCTTCGSALSPDQRYCLSCGTRRSGANLHFQQILAAEAAAQAPAVSPAQAADGAGGATTRSSMPALASIACLLLALGVGVLIGKSGSGSASAGTTQAVTAAPLATDAAAGAADAEATAAKKKSTTSDTPAASTAANPSLKKLESLSPEQYQKESLKLPKTVGTGGAPPPVDNKAPAGGGSFDTIG